MKRLVVILAVMSMLLISAVACGEVRYKPLTAEVTSAWLSVRDEAIGNSVRLAKAFNAQVLNLVLDDRGLPQRENGFIKIDVPNTLEEGWVREDLIKVEPDHLVIAEEGVVAYSSYTMKRSLTDELEPGSEYMILEDLEDFWVVNFRTASAWISKKSNAYIREDAEEYLEREAKQLTVKHQVRAYALPRVDSCAVKTFDAGDTISVVRETSEWYVIKLETRHAYIPKSDF